MMFVVFATAAGADCWLLWGLPSYMLSLLLTVQFTLDMEQLAPSLCWYLDVQVNRDEVKGIHPLAYEDGFSEAILAIFLFLDRLSVVCWQGVWRLLWFQPCGIEVQIVRVHIRAQDLRAYNRGIGSLSNNGLYFQCIFRLMLHPMDYRNSPIVKYVTAIWPHLYIKVLRMLYFVYIAHLSGVIGPCLTALVWQFNLPRKANWILDQDLSSIESPLNILVSLCFTASSFGSNLACMVIWIMLYDNVLNISAK